MRKLVILFVIVIALTTITANLLPKKVVFRIDDVWAFEGNNVGHGYTFENLENTLNVLEGQRVILGVTPFFFDSEKEIALENDPELIRFLQKQKMKGAKIAMHGYNHKCLKDESCEFDNKDYFQYIEMIWKGKKYLEKYFGVVSVFTPPKNHAELGVKQALKMANLRLENTGFEPIKSWNWKENTFEWNGFGDYDGEETIIIHYNAVDLEELELFIDNFG